MFKVNNEDNRTTSLTSFWRLCYFQIYFTFYFGVSIVDFEHMNIGCGDFGKVTSS